MDKDLVEKCLLEINKGMNLIKWQNSALKLRDILDKVIPIIREAAEKELDDKFTEEKLEFGLSVHESSWAAASKETADEIKKGLEEASWKYPGDFHVTIDKHKFQAIFDKYFKGD